MRVLEINSVAGLGSTGRIACQIADTVVSHGGEALVTYGRDMYSKGCNVQTYRIGSDFDVKIHGILSRITDRQGFYSKKATKDFVTFIESYNPDIIHLHNIHGYYLNLPILFGFLAKLNTPVVWTLHDCWAFTGHCAHFDYIGCQKWKAGCHHCPQKKSYPKSFLLDRSKKNWEQKKALFSSVKDLTIVTPSQWLANLVQESFLQKYPVQVINNGIDLEVFKPTESTWKEDHNITKPMIMACAAIWDSRKGYTDVIKLADLLPEYQVVIVGISAKQAKVLPSNTIGIQRTESVEELVKIYSAADVFVNPTYEDNFPTVNLESLACGTPVVTYDTGGSPECIVEGFGSVVNKGNVELLAKMVVSIINNSGCYGNIDLSQEILFNKEDKYQRYLQLFSERAKKYEFYE